MTEDQAKLDVAMIFAIRDHKKHSNDPKTKTCAAVVVNGIGAAMNTNVILHPEPETLSREERLAFSLHCEVHALLSCTHVLGGTLYVTGTPCHECAKVIITRGIMRVVIDHDEDPFYERLNAPEYHFDWAFDLFTRYGVQVVRLSLANQCAEGPRD